MTTLSINGYGCRAVTPDVAAALRAIGEDPDKFNRLHWPAGASRWSDGHFLVDKTTADQLKACGLTNAVVVVFEDDTNGAAGFVQCDAMYQIEHRPVKLWRKPDATNADALFDVHLVDARYFWQYKYSSPNSAVNVTLPTDRTKYYDATDNSGAAFTWAELLGKLINDLAASGDVQVNLDPVSTGASVPVDFLMDYEPSALMVDRVCAALGVVLCADTTIGPSGKRYVIDVPSQFNDEPSSIDSPSSPPAKDLLAGGTIYNPATADGQAWLNAIMPAAVIVQFPRQVVPAETDSETNANSAVLKQFKTVFSTNGKPTGVTGRSGASVVIHDKMWAIGPIGSETNATALTARADYLARRFYNRYRIQKIDCLLRGYHAIGLWPGTITWHHSTGGPFTRCAVDDYWFAYGLNRDVGEGFKRKRVIGLGGIQAYKTPDGSLVINSLAVTPPALFPVKVTQSAGSNGTGTTKATYTYRVFALDGTTALDGGTALVQTRPRPNGAVTYQTALSYGIAFYDGATLKLWDAGEVPQTFVCV